MNYAGVGDGYGWRRIDRKALSIFFGPYCRGQIHPHLSRAAEIVVVLPDPSTGKPTRLLDFPSMTDLPLTSFSPSSLKLVRFRLEG